MKKFIFFFFVIFIRFQANAQQTIFNVPSVDVLTKNKIFLQHESQFRAKDPGQFWAATNYFAHGIGYDTELNITQFNLSTPASQNVSLGIGAKNVFPLATKNSYQPKIIFGLMIPISLQGQGIGHWIYSSGSIIIPQSNTRLTAGISNGTKQIFGESVTCFIGGFEQKITDDFSLIADWYSGNHALGILATGFSYAFPQDFAFYGGYQIPNSKNVGRNSFVIEIAKTF
ncbi:MAG: hypothetical protein A3D15_00475 [Alphaproteobacteria bacterium RIFCSPHIGHO2_02_FULL_40_34]|nr:MAG: hypothetical protein A3D15_00475 [Alphaproteobacteria bacterium RIFCSPHIGHO2_02_FULL_40_34]OFW88893.1 MAG: hypothetical protein A2794_05375 [Alphaproteobacteria bacterium RIFCSPHIGHO2_01_FULL_40_8]OFX11904.1 MAG: hypothetical protein A3G22_03855 [Alphaproteobacteria bacterium RIFCSPLOWO2_12_FULL_40_11]